MLLFQSSLIFTRLPRVHVTGALIEKICIIFLFVIIIITINKSSAGIFKIVCVAPAQRSQGFSRTEWVTFDWLQGIHYSLCPGHELDTLASGRRSVAR
jgi:hypothetical protein